MGHLTIGDCHPSSRVRHWTEPTTLRKISVTLVLCWVKELGLQEWNAGCHPTSRLCHWTEPTTLKKEYVTLLLSWSIELNLPHLELKYMSKNSEVGWQEAGISPTFHGNGVTPKNMSLSLYISPPECGNGVTEIGWQPKLAKNSCHPISILQFLAFSVTLLPWCPSRKLSPYFQGQS